VSKKKELSHARSRATWKNRHTRLHRKAGCLLSNAAELPNNLWIGDRWYKVSRITLSETNTDRSPWQKLTYFFQIKTPGQLKK
jgi:hypothetical protein